MKVYKQMKMYNDPALNPVLYLSLIHICFYLGFPFAHQRNFLAWYTNEIDKRIYVLNQNSG